LADEPTASLDFQAGRQVVDLMRQMARKYNCAVLLVTHDHRILDIADRVLTMEDNQVIVSE
jgi:putative ABC transport system ATP-binding protein